MLATLSDPTRDAAAAVAMGVTVCRTLERAGPSVRIESSSIRRPMKMPMIPESANRPSGPHSIVNGRVRTARSTTVTSAAKIVFTASSTKNPRLVSIRGSAARTTKMLTAQQIIEAVAKPMPMRSGERNGQARLQARRVGAGEVHERRIAVLAPHEVTHDVEPQAGAAGLA